MNLLLEIADVLFVLCWLAAAYVAQRRKAGSWWKVLLSALVLGGGAGYVISRFVTGLDADFFPLAGTAITAWLAQWWFTRSATRR